LFRNEEKIAFHQPNRSGGHVANAEPKDSRNDPLRLGHVDVQLVHGAFYV
jgi:hypothetical protein